MYLVNLTTEKPSFIEATWTTLACNEFMRASQHLPSDFATYI